ncbi:sodium:proton antiporter [Halioglobus maricola]|uniref:Sodium:proton antiporter n=2 Tax=Halioglobus maricola TaxID=2601894 RepID=A0A5P9NPW7_9GAMM|nr:sodium:proton antiporter [Halioglobus maricola]
MAILFTCWLLWSGLYKPLLIGLGVFSSLLSLWLAQRMGFFRHAMPVRSLVRLPALWWWVLGEVIQSSIEVARVVLSPSLPIEPELVELTTQEKTDSGKVILGNSITLSPGTVTIDVDEDRLLVHCLTSASAAGLKSGEAERRTARLRLD